MKISVIIPVYNEQGVIGDTLRHIKATVDDDIAIEVIVVDGGSTDGTVREAQQDGVVVVKSPRKGRAAQMNEGAKVAKGDLLYFLHADTLPPQTFKQDLLQAVRQGYAMGCYRLQFDVDHWFLKANAWFTRFDLLPFRYGDQSLFVLKDKFDRVGGFCEGHIVMEDQEIIRRLRPLGKFIIMKKRIVTSARKYVVNGVYRMQAIFFLIYFMYQVGYSQEKLLATFRKLIRQDKL